MSLHQKLTALENAIGAFPAKDELLDALTQLWDAYYNLENGIEAYEHRLYLQDEHSQRELAAKEHR